MGRRLFALLLLAAASARGDETLISTSELVPPPHGVVYRGAYDGRYFYTGPAAALGSFPRSAVLRRGPVPYAYYVISDPEGRALSPGAYRGLGDAVSLGPSAVLLAVTDMAAGLGDLRAPNPQVDLWRLEPVTPSDWVYKGEPPPSTRDDRIAGALANITPQRYGGDILTLTGFMSRKADTPGGDAARDYLLNYFANQNLAATLFRFKCSRFVRAAYKGGVIFVETDSEAINRSRDRGGTWQSLAPAGINNLFCSFWVDGAVGFAAGDNNVFARTTNGGASWGTTRLGVNAGLEYRATGMGFADASTGWVCGYLYKGNENVGEFFIKTTDGGVHWSNETVPPGFRVRKVYVADGSHAWGVGAAAGDIIYTSDGGGHWRLCQAGFYEWDMAVAGPTTAWAVDGDGYLYRTLDGVNWSRMDVGVPGPFRQIVFGDASHGYAAGERFIKTEDAGVTWTEVPAPLSGLLNVLDCSGPREGILGSTYNQKLFLTVDGGASFQDLSGDLGLLAENVVGERRGTTHPDEVVIIGGHYDSVSELPVTLAPGAEDNASGTAVAMSAARAFRNTSFERTVRYVAFGAEEVGLVGSNAYAEWCAQNGEKVIAVLNADMVGFDEEKGLRDDYGVAYNQYQWLFDYLAGVASLYDTNLIYERYEYSGSDHSPFWSRGYAALGSIHGRANGPSGFTQGYIWYHTSQDTFDKLTPELGYRHARDYAATLAHLARVDDGCFERVPLNGATAPAGRDFAVYPNPYRLGRDRAVNFVGLATPATVEIYDLAGRRVARWEVGAQDRECAWYPATAGGEALAAGVYLYRVRGVGQDEQGKLAVIK